MVRRIWIRERKIPNKKRGPIRRFFRRKKHECIRIGIGVSIVSKCHLVKNLYLQACRN